MLCWLWKGARDKDGYGIASMRSARVRTVRAHRLAYETLRGPIPAGLTIDHLCRNPGCANPAHMEPVTAVENVMRGEGFAAKNANKTTCPRGHSLEGGYRFQRPDGRSYRACRPCTQKASRERMRARRASC